MQQEQANTVELVADFAEMQTAEGVYDAVHFVAKFCACEPCVLTALAQVMVDYLRSAPAAVRGPITSWVTEQIHEGVRESLH